MPKKHPFALQPRYGRSQTPTAEERKTGLRICKAVADSEPSPSITIFAAMRRVRHIPGIWEFLRELRLLDQWQVGVDDHWYATDGVVLLRTLQFLDRFVDRKGWYSARFYADTYGIQPGTLRQAVKAKRLGNRRDGKLTLYPFEGVQKLWSGVVTFFPEALESV